ncbi:MAG: hypothetical protein UIG59_03390 [Acutalibacteraceae bacterium]|nr:hypothetical protein [Acutalibacteraceae bacterium]
MNKYYDEIMQLKEGDELVALVKKWEILSGNIKNYPTDLPVLLPDMLWVAKSGVGQTRLLRLLSEYLASKGNLMDFYGDVKFFEFVLGYCKPDVEFTEIQRLMCEVSNAAGFRNEFRGIMRIDVNEWINHYEEKYFADFCEYLAANSEKWLIVLAVDTDDEKKIHNLEAFLSMYLRLEKITLSMPKTEDLFEYIERKLSGYGLTLSDDGKQLLTATINKLRKNRYFDGFKTIRLLCQEIAYTVFSKENLVSYNLTAKDLADFAPDSEFVSKTEINFEKTRKIGLVE